MSLMSPTSQPHPTSQPAVMSWVPPEGLPQADDMSGCDPAGTDAAHNPAQRQTKGAQGDAGRWSGAPAQDAPKAALADAHSASPLLATPEARRALQVLQEAGLAAPTAQELASVAGQAQGNVAHQQLVDAGRDALVGAGPAPTAAAWHKAYVSVWGQGIRGQSLAARNVTAYVFLMMLQAQMEAMREKREALAALKMHAGMLEDLNNWLARVVVPAQRSLNAKIKAGHAKDAGAKRDKAGKSSKRELRTEETIGMPKDVDTQWGAVDQATGKVFIPSLAQGAVVLTRVDAQDLSQLITQADQWRTTIQNHQSRDSINFKRIDDSMNSTWNQLTSFLKSAQEGANAIIRNGVG